MKTIFITGASSGLGKEAAKLFQREGWQVIATMRNPEKESELDKIDNIVIKKLDVSNAGNIKTAVAEILKDYDVDVVLNNAGYGLIGALEAFSDEQVVRQLDTNVLGTIRVTKAFVPYFREKKSGTFITITSMFGLIGYPTCSIYSASKFALDGFSESLAYELAQFDIAVKVIAPGGIKTDFATRSLDFASNELYDKLVSKVAEGYSEEAMAKYSSPEYVATVIYNAATDGRTQLRYIAGADATEFYTERQTLGSEPQFEKLRDMFTFTS